MKGITKLILIMSIAAVAVAGLAILAIRYMDVLQRQVEAFRDLIARHRRGGRTQMCADDGYDEEGVAESFEDFEASDEAIPDLSF